MILKKSMAKIKWFVGIFLLSIGLVFSQTETDKRSLRIAVAANMQPVLGKILELYKLKYPEIKAEMITGSSGALVAQIREGAPYDIFLSADTDRPDSLFSWGLATSKSIPYALGKLVLATSRKDLKLDPELRVLTQSTVKKIALADPLLAPYGKESQRVLQSRELWEPLKQKIVYASNISATAQFVSTGAADAGFLAKSTVISAKNQNFFFIDIPSHLYQPILQGMVGLNHKIAVLNFLNFMKSSEVSHILLAYGYDLPL